MKTTENNSKGGIMIDWNSWADFWRYDIGVNVIPADTKNKTTYVSWSQWQNKAIPKTQHDEWKENNAFSKGMAVICGKIHHKKDCDGLYLGCIDCDNQKAIDEMTSDLSKMAEKTIVELHTDDSSKCHIYFYTRTPLPKKSSDANNKTLHEKIQRNDVPAFEIKSLGAHGIMFCTPSLHQGGSYYEIISCKKPAIIEDIRMMINDICKKNGLSYSAGIENKIPMNELLRGKIEILEGHNRHEAMLRISDHYFVTGHEMERVVELVNARNMAICKPPLGISEIKKICVQSEEWIGKSSKKKKMQVHEIANRIMSEYNMVTLSGSHEILYYNEGVFRYNAEEIISQECRMIEDKVRNHDIREVIGIIQDKTGYKNTDDFDRNVFLVNVKNGMVDIRTGRLFDHHPKYLSRIQLPVFYDKNAIAEKFFRFLRSCHDDRYTAYSVLEMMAMCLIRDNHIFEMAYMNTGNGSNGKTVLFNILIAVLGRENLSYDSIHDIENGRFVMSNLDGKLANICADINPDEIKTTGNLKKIISGDMIGGEKKFRDAYTFRCFAKLIFSANQIPEVRDMTDAFVRRFIILEWNKQFFGEKRDNSINEIQYDSAELSGIFNVMLKIAQKMMSEKKLKYQDRVSDIKKKWMEKSDNITSFVNERCVMGDYKTTKAELYTEYVRFCTIKKTRIQKNMHFVEKIIDKGVTEIRPRVNGEPVRMLHGIALKSKIVNGSQEMLF